MRYKVVAASITMLVLSAASVALAGAGDIVKTSLNPTPLAINAGLENASGTAYVQVHKGVVSIIVDLGGAVLPSGSVLEGWVVDPGLQGGPGGAAATSVSDDDEQYGTPFGDASFDSMVDNSPYALSTGVLRPLGKGKYLVRFKIQNDLTPYNVVVVTLESDGNVENYDPRPGTPVLAGEF